jgi:hypothetical protein
MSTFDSVVVDTSTLLNLDPGRRHPVRSAWERHGRQMNWGAVEALVLFDHVVLDGPSIERNEERLGWLESLDDSGVKVQRLDTPGEAALYLRAASLFRSIDWSPTLLRLPVGDRDHHSLSEMMVPGQDIIRLSITSLDAVLNGLGKRVGQEVAQAFAAPFDTFPLDLRLFGLKGAFVDLFTDLVRMFYYLALQEQAGGLLLVHPRKDLGLGGGETPAYGYAPEILRAFDAQVLQAYAKRRARWLGEAPTALPMPPLARFVMAEAERRGWNVGRTIAWLRRQPEVRSFRRGMAALADAVDAGDKATVDAVLHELQAATDKWTRRIGAPTRPATRFTLQASLPFLQPAVDIPLPLPARSPAQRMLGLMKWVTLQS